MVLDCPCISLNKFQSSEAAIIPQNWCNSIRWWLSNNWFVALLCREALPAESNYRNLLSFGRSSGKARPTLEELREEEGGLKVRSRQCGNCLNAANWSLLKFKIFMTFPMYLVACVKKPMWHFGMTAKAVVLHKRVRAELLWGRRGVKGGCRKSELTALPSPTSPLLQILPLLLIFLNHCHSR